MRLTKLRIKNFRSIKDTGDINVEPLQALVGENNAGKSNILRAIQCFLTAGAGGMAVSDFNDQTTPCSIECEFSSLSNDEKKSIKPYLLGDKIILRKELAIVADETKGKVSVKAEYHGYHAEPKAEHLSIEKIEKAHGSKPKWKEIAEKAQIVQFVSDADGKINKTTYRTGLAHYLAENAVEYDEPELGKTQALGIPQNLLSVLPEFYLLPAITDYSDEIDRRSSTTVFRRLMSDLSDRIMRADDRYKELDETISRLRGLLNVSQKEGAPARIEALTKVENSLRDIVKKLMPSVQSVSLGVEIEECHELFSRGVSIKIDDGVLTDVVEKGHGLQRSMVFSLLQMLMSSRRENGSSRPIILAIEEPELYIHPHCQRLIFRVLREFAGAVDSEEAVKGADQVLYTTHSPAFVDVWRYERIGVVRKPELNTGTVVRQAARGTIAADSDRKTFKLLNSFGLKHNEVFFGRYAILVEGAEDEVGVIAAARKLGKFEELPDEVGLSIVVASKGEIPKFQKILSALGFEYGVLLEMDGKNEEDSQNKAIIDELKGNRIGKVPKRIEDMLGVGRHFDDQFHAKKFFSEPGNIKADFENVVQSILPT